MQGVAIIGPGRVGTALWLAVAGHLERIGAAGGSPASQELFQRRTGQVVQPSALLLCGRADWVFLTVPDRVVGPLCAELAQAGAFHSGQIVVHTAGALTSQSLAPALGCGAEILALHPMQSFADPSRGPALFQGITCSLEGSPAARRAGEELARQLGMRPWQVQAPDKLRLHAAASLE